MYDYVICLFVGLFHLIENLTAVILNGTTVEVEWNVNSDIIKQFYFYNITAVDVFGHYYLRNIIASETRLNDNNDDTYSDRVVLTGLQPEASYGFGLTVTLCRTQNKVTECGITTLQSVETTCGGI